MLQAGVTLQIDREFLGHHEGCVGEVFLVSNQFSGERLCFACGVRGPEARLVSEVFRVSLDFNLDITVVDTAARDYVRLQPDAFCKATAVGEDGLLPRARY